MTYKNVDIPFVTGMNEAFDKAILPVGPMRRVQDSMLDRTGRMSARPGIDKRSTSPIASPNDLVIALGNEDDAILRGGGEVRAYRWDGAREDRKGDPKAQVYQLAGTAGGLGAAETFGVPAISTNNHQVTPTVTISQEAVLYCWIERILVNAALANNTDLSTLVVEARDKDTGRTMWRWSQVSDSGGYGRFRQANIVSTEMGTSFMVVVGCNVNGGTISNSYLTFILFDKVGAVPTFSDLTLSPATTDYFDVAPSKDEHTFRLIYGRAPDGTSWVYNGEATLQRLSFATPPVVLDSAIAKVDSTASTLANVRQLMVATAGCSNSRLWGAIGSMPFTGRVGVGVTCKLSGTTHYFNIQGIGSTSLLLGGLAMECTSNNEAILVFSQWSNPSSTTGSHRQWRTRVIRLRCVSTGGGISVVSDKIILGFNVTGPWILNDVYGEQVLVGINNKYDVLTFNPSNYRQATCLIEARPEGGQPACHGVIAQTGIDGEPIYTNRGWIYVSAGAFNGAKGFPYPAPPRPAHYQTEEKGFWIQPMELSGQYRENPVEVNYPVTTGIRAFFSTMQSHLNLSAFQSVQRDNIEALYSGAFQAVTGPSQFFQAGFSGPPTIYPFLTTPGTVPAGRVTISAVMEFIDSRGRAWRSRPCTPIDVTVPAGGANIIVDYFPSSGFPAGAVVAVYRTPVNGSVFYRCFDFPATTAPVDTSASGIVARTIYNDDTKLKDRAMTLYTSGGVLGNDVPPACKYLAVLRDRVWAGGLDDPTRIQSSKFLRTTEGVHWSNADQFFANLTDACTGLAAMDNAVVAFTRDGIHLVNGQGPSDQGQGFYTQPQRIPTDLGCVNGASVVTTSDGVWFQSRRGLELLARGFALAEFGGAPVRDLTEAFPHCLDARYISESKTARFLMANSPQKPTAAIVLVFDGTSHCWYVHTYEQESTASAVLTMLGRGTVDGLGEVRNRDALVAGFGNSTGLAFFQPLISALYVETISVRTPEAQIWRTGDVRPAGIQAGAYGRRIHLLGTFIADSDVTIRMGYNGGPLKYEKTWQLRAADHQPFDEIELELTLPVMKFSSAWFEVEAKPVLTTPREHFRAHGLCLYVDTEGEGPRLAARFKG